MPTFLRRLPSAAFGATRLRKFSLPGVWLLAVGSIAAADLRFQLMGTAPAAEHVVSTAIHALIPVGDSLYIGLGSPDPTTPPMLLTRYHPATQTFTLEHSLGGCTMGSLRQTSAGLAVTTLAPLAGPDAADFALRDAAGWSDYLPIGFRRSVDVTTTTDGSLWLCGYESQQAAFGTSTTRRALWRGNMEAGTWTSAFSSALDIPIDWCPSDGSRVFIRDGSHDGISFDPPPTPSIGIHGPGARPERFGHEGRQMISYVRNKPPGWTGYGDTHGSIITRDLHTTQEFLLNPAGSGFSSRVQDHCFDNNALYALVQYTGGGATPNFALGRTKDLIPPVTWERFNILNTTGIYPDQATAVAVLDGVVYLGTIRGALWAARLDGAALPTAAPQVVSALPDGLGRALSVDGDRVAVGLPRFSGARWQSGKVAVYRLHAETAGAPPTWALEAELEAPLALQNAFFGASLALSGNLLSVCAPGEAPGGIVLGAVYVYRREGEAWVLRGTLNNKSSSSFTNGSVTLSGNRLLVGGNIAANQNSARLYPLNETPGQPAIGTLEKSFGDSFSTFLTPLTTTDVTLEGDWAALATRGQLTEAGGLGRVTVLHRGSDGLWTLVVRLWRGDRFSMPLPDGFGYCLKLVGDWLFVGAPLSDDAGPNTGAVLVYRRQEIDGNYSYSLAQTLTSPDPALAQNFGCSVAAQDDWLVVGADRTNGVIPQAGAAYVYRQINGVWSLQRRLQPPPNGFRRFGAALSLWQGQVLTGSHVSPSALPVNERVIALPLQSWPESYRTWTGLQGLTSTQTAPELDPDNDGLPNLIEFAGDLNPRQPQTRDLTAPPSPLPRLVPSPTGGWNLVVEYRLDPALDSQFELSENGTSWHPPAEPPTSTVFNETWRQLTLPLPAGPLQLCRLRYTLTAR